MVYKARVFHQANLFARSDVSPVSSTYIWNENSSPKREVKKELSALSQKRSQCIPGSFEGTKYMEIGVKYVKE